jgi:hypothetical protein
MTRRHDAPEVRKPLRRVSTGKFMRPSVVGENELGPAGGIRLKLGTHLPRRRIPADQNRGKKMKGYKEPGFQDRAQASARAKKKALEQMKPMPMPDEAEVAARVARRAEREAKAEGKRAAARAEQGEPEDREKAVMAEAEQGKIESPERTEMEKKEARDARYAARKSRNSGRS